MPLTARPISMSGVTLAYNGELEVFTRRDERSERRQPILHVAMSPTGSRSLPFRGKAS